MTERLTVETLPISSLSMDDIKQDWQRIEKLADNSIFTSWNWMKTWLTHIDDTPLLLKISFNHQTVGLGFLCKHSYIKYGIVSKQLWLNRTGLPNKDQIWNEYNDILCAKGHEYAIRAAVLSHFEQELSQYDEIIFGVSNASIVETPHNNKLMQLATWQTPSYHTALNPQFENWLEYLKTLSGNSRSQIKRTAKLFGGLENIEIIRAESKEQAQTFFNEAGKLHKVRWENQNSGFNNPQFVKFHNKLIEHNFNNDIIDILKIQSNTQTICYLYNFLYKNKVYFYLSGIEYSSDNRLKPGLLSHSLAISYYSKLGYKTYDFMGGEGRYKKSLCNEEGTMIISNYRRKKLPFIASHLLRRIKQAVA